MFIFKAVPEMSFAAPCGEGYLFGGLLPFSITHAPDDNRGAARPAQPGPCHLQSLKPGHWHPKQEATRGPPGAVCPRGQPPAPKQDPGAGKPLLTLGWTWALKVLNWCLNFIVFTDDQWYLLQTPREQVREAGQCLHPRELPVPCLGGRRRGESRTRDVALENCHSLA